MNIETDIEDITIRRAYSKDIDLICDLWSTLAEDQFQMDARFALSADARTRWRNDFPMWIRDRSHLILLAITGEGPAGFIHCRRFAPGAMFVEVPEVYIEALYVLPDYRRKGLGSEFVQMAREWSGALGVKRMRFNVLARNESAIRFWSNEGSDSAMIMATIDLDDQL